MKVHPTFQSLTFADTWIVCMLDTWVEKVVSEGYKPKFHFLAPPPFITSNPSVLPISRYPSSSLSKYPSISMAIEHQKTNLLLREELAWAMLDNVALTNQTLLLFRWIMKLQKFSGPSCFRVVQLSISFSDLYRTSQSSPWTYHFFFFWACWCLLCRSPLS